MSSNLSRRAFLGAALGTVALTGCSQAIDKLAQPDLPKTLKPPGGETRHPIAHLLNRAAYGPRPGDIEDIEKTGRERWLNRQLDYKRIDDNAMDWRLRRYDTLKMKSVDLMGFTGDKEELADELARATLLRAVFSKRQLYEVMVGFWTDHFSIYQFKDKVVFLKTIDDQEVIRRHALGKFGDLLKASAHSPAMLHYLDNTVNEKSHPNENYAREIMELHTLGVDGGYTERDIQEVARCFTGLTMNRRGEWTFRSEWHDEGKKQVLGQEIEADGGERDIDRVLDILLEHPSTAKFICTKLARRFFADDPPPELVNACIATWQEHDGDIASVLRTIFTYPDFDNAPLKFKRPFELLVSILRATNAEYDGGTDLVRRLETMGHRPFNWITPDGYPDVATLWSNGIYRYWKLESDAATNRLPDVKVDLWEIARHVKVERHADRMLEFFGRLFLSRDLTAEELTTLWQFALGDGARDLDLDDEDDRNKMIDTLGMLLMSPAFQWR